MSEPLIEDVSDTALWVATYRALETERPDALFRDPLADRLVGERGRQIAREMQGTRAFSWSIVIRTCIIDDYIRTAIAEGVDTVVNLGAGLDTRPYRMDLPPTLRWVEVDYPKIIQLKEARLRTEAPVCRLERRTLDLTQREERREFFARLNAESRKVLVLTEGVVPYLSVEETTALAQDLREQERFGYWVVDYMSPLFIAQMRKSGVFKRRLKNAPFKFDPQDWEGFFSAQGWKVREMRYHTEESVRLGRSIPAPWLFKLVYPLMPRAMKDQIRQMSGFALLEPK